MKENFFKKFYYFVSILFLSIISFLLIFVVTISIKPIKLNFLDYFDRESKIFKKYDISEVGDLFISFDKVSKNFQLIAENIVIKDSYIPNIQINIDLNLSLSEKFIQPTIKIFDAEVSFDISQFEYSKTNNSLPLSELKNKISFLNFFKKIEVINSYVKINSIKNNSNDFLIDFKYDLNEISGYISQQMNDDNFLSFNIINKKGKKFSDISFKNFDLDFLKVFYAPSLFLTDGLKISGKSIISLNDNNEFDELLFDLFIRGGISYETFDGRENLFLNNTKLSGQLVEEEIRISFDLQHQKSIFSFGTSFNLNKKDTPNIFVKINHINVNNLLKVWPKDFKESVYSWMSDNSKGLIDNFVINLDFSNLNNNLSLENIDGGFDFKDTEIKYMDSMPSIIMINGKAKIFSDKIIFYVDNGSSQKLKLVDGYVSLYDLDTDSEKADIKLRIISENKDAVEYLDTSPIDKKNFTKLRKIKGEADIDLNLNFPLLLDLKAEEIEYESKVNIYNASINNLFYKISLEKLTLSLLVNNDEVEYSGDALVKESVINFNGKQYIYDNLVRDEISGNINLIAESIEEISQGIFSKSFGSIPIDFKYSSDNKDLIKVEAIGTLDNFASKSEFLGDNLNFKNGKLRFLLNPFNNDYSIFFDFKTPNIQFETNLDVIDKKIKKISVNKFISPNQDFYGMIKNEDYLDILIQGSKLKFNKLKSLQNNGNPIFTNMDLTIDIDELYLNNIPFKQPEFSFSKRNGLYNRFYSKLSNTENIHKVSITSDNKESFFNLSSNNFSELLRIFNFDLNTEAGEIEINGAKDLNESKYVGNIDVKDFILTDAPFLADFFTLFSLQGLAQKLKGGGVFFESCQGKYEFYDDKINLSDSLIKGSELGIQFDADLDLDTDIFYAKGSVIPAYTINTLLTKFPIVGDIITAGSPEDGLIGANFEIENINDEYKISFNPISVFVPNLIKNFLGN